MLTSLSSLHHYPYPWKLFAAIVTALILVVIGLPVYGIYRLIIRRMTEKGKAVFHRILKISGICLLVIFFGQMTLALITEHQVNKQLGFSYATPETFEGEFFIITKVVPGGVMDKAGLKLYDQVQMNSVPKFYRLLINNQGKEVTFTVLRNRQEVEIKVIVPRMQLPLRKICISY